jgi:transposase
MTLITLNHRERRVIEQLITSTSEATTLRRAQAVLWLAQGESVAAVAERLCVTRQAVYQWATRINECSAKELAAQLAEGERTGRPRTVAGIIDPLIDAIIDTDPRSLSYRSTVWTAPLLAQYLADHHQMVVSRPSVSLALARLEISWKRPRHRLSLRAKFWRQAKGG